MTKGVGGQSGSDSGGELGSRVSAWDTSGLLMFARSTRLPPIRKIQEGVG